MKEQKQTLKERVYSSIKSVNNTIIELIKKGFNKKIILDALAVISLMLILLYRVDTLKNLCVAIYNYIVSQRIPSYILSSIKQHYPLIEKLADYYLVIWLFITIVFIVSRWIWTRKLSKKQGDDAFEESVFRYLNEKNSVHCFLISGPWGSGKTYVLNNFVEKYLSFSNREVYRVSCYGLDSRGAVENELNKVIKEKDNTFSSHVVDIIQCVPIIGEPLYKLFNKRYSISSVRKNSVFVFDDFERIGSCIDRSFSQYNGATHVFNNLVHQSPVYVNGLDTVNDVLDSINQGVHSIGTELNRTNTNKMYDKYTSIVGLINELTESYGIKVFVICNTKELDKQFLSDTFTNKLNCIEYKKEISNHVKENIIESIIKNKYSDETKKLKTITNYLRKVKKIASSINLGRPFDDLRLYSNIFEAFVYTAMLYDEKKLTDSFLSSLLNSIIIGHRAFYNNEIKLLDTYNIGMSLRFADKLFATSHIVGDLVLSSDNNIDCQWVGKNVALYWISNSTLGSELENDYIIWNEYRFFADETELVCDYKHFKDMTEFDINHLAFYVKNEKKIEGDKLDYGYYIDVLLQEYDVSDSTILQYVLDHLGALFNVCCFEVFEEIFFEKLINQGATDVKIQSNSLARRYSEFVENKKAVIKE